MKCTAVLFFLCSCYVYQGYTDRIVLFTDKQFGTVFNFFPLKTSRLLLSVKATNDVHVVLTSSPIYNAPYYELVIGGWTNTKSTIEKDNGNHQVEYDAAVIKPNTYQTFVININDAEGSISVGKRTGEPFMMFKDPDYVKMSYFGISTGYGSTGEWNIEFNSLYCNCTTCS